MTEHSAADPGSKASDRADNSPSIVPGVSDMSAKDAPEPASTVPSASTPAEFQGSAVPADPVTPETDRETTRNSSNIMILWPERPESSASSSYADDDGFTRKPNARASLRRRRLMAMAAVIAVAAVCGAAGGSLATLALGHLSAPQDTKTAAVDETAPLRDAVARLTADIGGLKADLDRTGKSRTAQIGKLGDRLEKVEKSQEDTATKVGKIGDAQEKMQDKLRAASASAAPETTGSIAATPAKTDAGKKLGIVDGWTLSRVSGGGAIVNGPMGAYEAYPGDPLPGLGRVDAVRYQDGRWVVVTQKGLIVRR
ncbi:hypothetical protein [Bradyrhizobium prioriisuperbiae]|uniref:hypothetical protein n=1 Tax=Bradyrhizobium prioriisuperbiae TaxID=2854389 RepID=UPI0028E3DB36|nr:hypothetical protein [Bradyrhizobium prioritasuperba]